MSAGRRRMYNERQRIIVGKGGPGGEQMVDLSTRTVSPAGTRTVDRRLQFFRRLLFGTASRPDDLADGALRPRRLPQRAAVLSATANRGRVQGFRGRLPLPALPAGAARPDSTARTRHRRHRRRADPTVAG